MFVEDIRRAVMAAPRVKLPELAGALWKSHAAGAISDDDAQALAELIQARKSIVVAPAQPRRVGSRPRSDASMERRRAWTASGWLPPTIASRFTMGEAAAIGVIMAEIALKGRCELPYGAVGGRAGVSVSTVKRALVQARRLGLVAVEERRVSWCRNLPNIITVLSAELWTWVATRGRGLRAAKGEGFKSEPPRSPYFLPTAAKTPQTAWKPGNQREKHQRRDYAGNAAIPIRKSS